MKGGPLNCKRHNHKYNTPMRLSVIFLCAIFLSLLSFECRAEDGYMAMPDRYLGYWEPRGRSLAGHGVDVLPGTIWWQQDPDYYNDVAPEDLYKTLQQDYKVFYIDDAPPDTSTSQYVYAVVKDLNILEAVLRHFDMAENGTPEEKQARQEVLARIMAPSYGYIRLDLSRRPDEEDREYLQIADFCNLPEEEWSWPAEKHRERIIKGDEVCLDYMSTRTWDRDIH